MSSSVVLPRALSTATTRLPSSFAFAMRRAAREMRSASPTEVPPNFMTTVSGMTVNLNHARDEGHDAGGQRQPQSPAALDRDVEAVEREAEVGRDDGAERHTGEGD